MFKAGVIEGSTKTTDRSKKTLMVAELPSSCCRKMLPVELESELPRNDEPETCTDETFWVLKAPPPLCKNVEKALRTLQKLIEQFCNKRESEACTWRPPPLTKTFVA